MRPRIVPTPSPGPARTAGQLGLRLIYRIHCFILHVNYIALTLSVPLLYFDYYYIFDRLGL